MTDYLVGNTVRLTVFFRDENQILVNPNSVFLIINKAGELGTTKQFGVGGSNIFNPYTGTFYSDVFLDTIGGWNYYWFSSGTASAENGQFTVTHSGV